MRNHIRKKQNVLYGLLTAFLMSSIGSAQAQFSVLSTLATHGESDVPANMTICVEFSAGGDTVSINTSTFTVRGQRFGVYPGSFTFPASTRVEFSPTPSFLFGENFEIEALGCTNITFANTLSGLGNGPSGDIFLDDFDDDGDLDALVNNKPQPTQSTLSQ